MADASSSPDTTAAAHSHVVILEAFPLHSRTLSIRTHECPIPILRGNVRTPATTPTTAIRRPAVGNARRQSYVLTRHPFRYLPVIIYTLLFIYKVSCSEYLCQDTLVCVSKPIDCPCPNVEDIKCIVPDSQDGGSGTRFCIRGGTDCAQIEKLANKFSQ